MLKVGFREDSIWACEKMISPGRRLTRPAPLRMALSFARERPLRFERMEPASDMESGSLNFLGGAKSRPVKLPDLRSAYLLVSLVQCLACIQCFQQSNLRARECGHLIERAHQRRSNRHLR